MPEASAMIQKPIEVGEVAPSFSLPSAQGATLELREVVQRGPVFLWFAKGMV